jgi:hypothetical protein
MVYCEPYTIFLTYINDLPLIFYDNCDPTQLNDNNIFCLLYADDLVLISESSSGLQRCLDKLSLYCNSWDLTVNFNKSKVMIFNKSGRKINKDKFIFNNSALEYCTEYKYLGMLFKPSGSFTEATNLLCKKASKAIFCIRKLLFSENNKCGHRNVLSKRQVWMSIFHIINIKKKILDTGSWIFFSKKLILDYYFCLKFGPVFLFQIFIIAPLPLPRDIKLYH